MQGVRTIRPSSAHLWGFWTFWTAKKRLFLTQIDPRMRMQGVRRIRPSSAHLWGFWTFWAAKIGYFWRKYLECVCKASEGFGLLPPIFGVFELLDLFHYTTFLPYLPCLLPYLPAFRIFFSSFSRAGAPFGPLFESRPLLSYFGKKKYSLDVLDEKI